jgi:hypothetical protein
MTGTTLDRRRRDAATRLDHGMIEGALCVYCGATVNPRMTASGWTRNLDHFIPVEIIIRAREAFPRRRFPNWLLPCCRVCNNLVGQLFFIEFHGKFDFMQWKLDRQHASPCRTTGQACPQTLRALAVPAALADIVRPMAEYRAGDYLILAPVRLESGDWSIAQPHAEKVLQCSSRIPHSAPSKTVFSSSPAM